jgi:diguanylate cyclase (GGDEF)-like protein/PAS domain S-box-containing protein
MSRLRAAPWPYVVALLATLAAALLSAAFAPVLLETPSVLFIGAVALSAWAGGLRPGLLATGLGAILYGSFLAPAAVISAVGSPLVGLYLGGFFLVELLVTGLTALLREDIARRRHAQAALEQAYADLQEAEAGRARLAAIIEATPDLVAIADGAGRRVYLNPAGHELLGLAPGADIAAGRLDDDRPAWAREQFQHEILPAVARDGKWAGESAYVDGAGREIPVSKVVLTHPNPDGSIGFYSTIARDITARKRLEAQLAQQAREMLAANAELASANTVLEERAATDTLTGLANRDRSDAVLAKFIALAERQQVPLSLAFLDLDHFKRVNDQYGHLVGDQVLSAFGTLLRTSFRGADVVARWGGEEFVVGMFGTTRQHAVRRLAVVLTELRDRPFTAPDGTSFHVTCSAGVAQYPTDAPDVATLHRLADQALYLAKAAGRDRVVTAS